MLNIKWLEVDGLHGWNHTIILKFDLSEPVHFITGRNGSGKTTLLKLIDAVANQNWSVFADIEFRRLSLQLVDSEGENTGLLIRCEQLDGNPKEKRFELSSLDGTSLLSGSLPKSKHDKAVEFLVDKGIIWPAHCGRHWASRQNPHMYPSEVIRVHRGQLPRHLLSTFWNAEPLLELKSKFFVHLIETSRLYASSSSYSGSTYRNTKGPFGDNQDEGVRQIVEDVPDGIKKQIASVDMRSAVQTEKLLSSVFGNALYEKNSDFTSESDINRILDDLSAKQKMLGYLVKSTNTSYLPERIDNSRIGPNSELRTAKLVLESIEERWKPYLDLHKKLEIFRKMFYSVCPRLPISFSRKDGLQIDGGKVQPCDLSSGQQHQLLMLFTLIFKSRSGQLVLIDEPEMSMDIEWQQEISSRLEQIAKLNNCKFLLATHSYEVVGGDESLRTDISAHKNAS